KHAEAASHTLLALGDALARGHFDVVHLHAAGPALFSFASRLAGMPTVATLHALDHRRAKWGRAAAAALGLGARAAVTFPDRTIVVSKELQRFARERFGRDTVVIPNGVDVAAFADMRPVAGLAPDRFLLFLGRLVPEKGVHTLIRAFRATDLDLPLAIVGPGTHTDDYVREL